MTIISSFLSLLLQSLEVGESVVLATIVANKGSTPRTAGTRMLIHTDGSFAGTVGGGIVEAEVIRSAKELFQSGGVRLLSFDLGSQELAQSVDMICGGTLDVLIEHLEACRENLGIYTAAFDAVRAGRSGLMIGELPRIGERAPEVRRCVLQEGREMIGACSVDSTHLQSLLDDFESGLETSLVEVSGKRLLVEPFYAPDAVYLFGAGHVARHTASLAANVGFRTVVLDDRAELANADRFPAADEVHVLPSFHEPMQRVAIDGRSYVVIVTRGHSHDKTVLSHALRTKACYIGMIGSRRKRDSIYRLLLEEGFQQRDIDRVHCPIGLSIGAETPEEIAVSIVGELIQVRAYLKKRQRAVK